MRAIIDLLQCIEKGKGTCYGAMSQEIHPRSNTATSAICLLVEDCVSQLECTRQPREHWEKEWLDTAYKSSIRYRLKLGKQQLQNFEHFYDHSSSVTGLLYRLPIMHRSLHYTVRRCDCSQGGCTFLKADTSLLLT